MGDLPKSQPGSPRPDRTSQGRSLKLVIIIVSIIVGMSLLGFFGYRAYRMKKAEALLDCIGATGGRGGGFECFP
jgi:hypothetical protein